MLRFKVLGSGLVRLPQARPKTSMLSSASSSRDNCISPKRMTPAEARKCLFCREVNSTTLALARFISFPHYRCCHGAGGGTAKENQLSCTFPAIEPRTGRNSSSRVQQSTLHHSCHTLHPGDHVLQAPSLPLCAMISLHAVKRLASNRLPCRSRVV